MRMFPRDWVNPHGHVLAFFHKPENPQARERLRESNVLGLGIGVKETTGRLTGDAALQVYVQRKVVRTKLARRHRIPTAIDGTVTDVVQIPRPRFQSSALQIGWPVAPLGGFEGSIGGVLTRPGDNTYYLLSAAHVFLQSANAKIGDPVLSSQGFTDPAHPLAVLSDFEPLKPAPFSNRFDAAIARLTRKSDMELVIPEIGPLKPTPVVSVRYQSVRKYGMATLHTLGIVTAQQFDTTIPGANQDYLFSGILVVTGCGGDFSAAGDSGALVVDALSGQPVGTIIGGAGPRTFVSPIDQILSRFNCKIAQ
jgi:hypothetical protein